jgi:hypothetical protein
MLTIAIRWLQVGLIACVLASVSSDLQFWELDSFGARKAAADEGETASTMAEAAKVEFFEKRIRPVLVERCWSCHASDSKKPNGGLKLDRRESLLSGGDSGPAVSLDMPNASLLIEAISYSGSVTEMPPDGKLPGAVIEDFRQWIASGAVFPGGGATPTSQPRQVDMEAGKRFWSFAPLTRRLPSEIRRRVDLHGRIDAFVIDSLESQRLTPAPIASRRDLFRRLSFSLRGVPPTDDEWSEWSHDASSLSADGLQRWAERWLASPRYGERWGRNWLDVARYGEDNPTSESTCGAPRFPYRYRDWVINAWNRDLPYNEMVRRQLAADLMDVESTEIAALGFLGLSPVYHKEPKLSADVIATIVADEWDERIDAVTRGFLGLTVACARCHDHKFDPIRTEDYYALAGVMASTQLVEWPLEPLDPTAAEALTEVQRNIVDAQLRFDYAKKIRDTAKLEGKELAPFEEDVRRRGDELTRWKETPLFSGAIANAVRDAGLWLDGSDPSWTWLDYRPGEPRDLPVFIRGNANRPGAKAPRRFLEVLSSPSTPLFPTTSSGRREMAEAIVTNAGPLTARVIVNRVWGWQFGQGLSRTPSNFGLLGDSPSHPELLDDLTASFVEAEWSLKWLHREIVSSSTWQRASEAARAGDSDNRWLAHRTRSRLEPEAWRDAVLVGHWTA